MCESWWTGGVEPGPLHLMNHSHHRLDFGPLKKSKLSSSGRGLTDSILHYILIIFRGFGSELERVVLQSVVQPPAPPVHLQVPLGKTLNPKLLLCHRCVNDGTWQLAW